MLAGTSARHDATEHLREALMEFDVGEQTVLMVLKMDVGLVVECGEGWLGYVSTAPEGASVMEEIVVGERLPWAGSGRLGREWRSSCSRRATRREHKWSRRRLHGPLGSGVQRRVSAEAKYCPGPLCEMLGWARFPIGAARRVAMSAGPGRRGRGTSPITVREKRPPAEV
jgi:hypothetical protein